MTDVQALGVACAAFIFGVSVAAGVARGLASREDSENVRAAYRWGDQWKARYEAIFGPRVSRVEVIDEHGREYVAYGVRVRDFALQDEGQTLKVFLETRPHFPVVTRIGEYQTVDLEPTDEIAVVPWGVTDEQREALTRATHEAMELSADAIGALSDAAGRAADATLDHDEATQRARANAEMQMRETED